MGDPQGLRHVLAGDPPLLTPLVTALARHAGKKHRRSTGETEDPWAGTRTGVAATATESAHADAGTVTFAGN